MSTDRPDPSWSTEKRVAYMREKYGENRLEDPRTKRPLSWEEVVRLFDGKGIKT